MLVIFEAQNYAAILDSAVDMFLPIGVHIGAGGVIDVAVELDLRLAVVRDPDQLGFDTLHGGGRAVCVAEFEMAALEIVEIVLREAVADQEQAEAIAGTDVERRRTDRKSTRRNSSP